MERLWTVSELLSWVANYFKDKQIEEPRLEAEVLLAYCLQIPRLALYTSFDRPVSVEERDNLKPLLRRRAAGEPMAYLTGQKEFMSLAFKVSPAVLIPRPDTEILVERAIDIIKEHNMRAVIDVGTGSGAIAISISYYLPYLQVEAVDISPEALAVAQDNAARLGVADRISFRQSDLLAVAPGPYDLIAANLPYIPVADYNNIPDSVRSYEPGLALWAGEDGFDAYRRLIPEVLNKLNRMGCILMEIDPRQQNLAAELLAEFCQVRFHKDLAGRVRVVEAWKG